MTKFVVIKGLFMVSSTLPEHGILDSMKLYYFFWLHMVSEDHCVYVKKTIKGIMFLPLYVDNILGWKQHGDDQNH